MKKFLLIMFLALGLVGCAQKELPLPQPENGVFKSNTTTRDAENILFDACTRAKWQITNKGQNFMKISLNIRDYNFDAVIEYSNTRYAILFERVNRDRGNLKESYAIFKKYATKLNRVIQKSNVAR